MARCPEYPLSSGWPVPSKIGDDRQKLPCRLGCGALDQTSSDSVTVDGSQTRTATLPFWPATAPEALYAKSPKSFRYAGSPALTNDRTQVSVREDDNVKANLLEAVMIEQGNPA